MATSKTRQKLVDVARQLFAKNGFENTTMNDIAVASEKGRRTLYTYFKSKDDIYYAVIEAEMQRLSDRMSEVAKRNIRPEEKIVDLIYTHLNLVKESVLRNGNLRAEFFRDIWMVEKVRKEFDTAEIRFLTDILSEGVRREEFNVENIPLVADIIHYCIKGLEVPYIYGRLGEGLSELTSRPLVRTLVNRALGKKHSI
ncbi:MAG: TetR/AcrR family transcriptional regulator [Paraprevotella sp.]|jgi:transcriptional regulator, tetR family|nr:TetR/AcrR family transcriptional regulator [Paraprevotella sp.]MBP3471631.1 TetR/AcrR family transcriptional regulator [Paraprevotella sp.]